MISAVDDFKEAQSRVLRRYGVEADSIYIDVPSVSGSTHVLVSGEGDPVVMVPGFADPTAMWIPLMARLQGLRLYAVDRPCFGLTGPARYESSTFRRLAVDFLEQVLDALGLDQPHFIGNSIGSNWIMSLGVERPDRVGRAVHIGWPAFILGSSGPMPLRMLSLPGVGKISAAFSPPSHRQVEKFARMVASVDLSGMTEFREMLIASQKMPGMIDAMRELIHAIIRFRGAQPEVVIDDQDLRRTGQPTLLIWGANDRFGGPELGREAVSLMQDAEMVMIEGGGHAPWIDHPEEVGSHARRFLQAPQK